MHQILLPGIPEGISRINEVVSFLNKEGRVTWFVGSDNYFSHSIDNRHSFAFIISSLMDNGHARARDFQNSSLQIPHRTLMNWVRRLRQAGPDSFYRPGRKRSGTIMTEEKTLECNAWLAKGLSIAAAARSAGVDESTFRKAVGSGKLIVPSRDLIQPNPSLASTKSERTQADAAAPMGTACLRSDERVLAARGVAGAVTRFEHSQDVQLGGVLAGLPALCANGLLSGLEKHLSLPKGYYSALNIIMTLAFMALCRLRRPEALRHQSPGELGKSVGLDRVPEVRTLREKISLMSSNGTPRAWMNELAKRWMNEDPAEAGYLYVDGHVRVYHGALATLPRRYVSREKLCLRGTTDYWINDALGRPFFVVSKAVTEGLEAVLLRDILPQLLANVPQQPDEQKLRADPLLPRFVMIFDREGATHKLLSNLWQHRVAAITYRKSVKDEWPSNDFIEQEVISPDGSKLKMRLATRQNEIRSGDKSLPVVEVRRLSDSGHQTSIITTARQMQTPAVAGRMFSRWCQENYFAYMMEHYDIDGLLQYGSEELPGTTQVVNPAHRELDVKVREARHQLRKYEAQLGKLEFDNSDDVNGRSEKHQDIQAQKKLLEDLRAQRRKTPRKICIDELPPNIRPQQLPPLAKTLTDCVKMIAYRAETALMGLLRAHLKKADEARALIRELMVSAADIEPDESAKTLTIKIHRMASPSHDKSISSLLADLTREEFSHPETGARMIFRLI